MAEIAPGRPLLPEFPGGSHFRPKGLALAAAGAAAGEGPAPPAPRDDDTAKEPVRSPSQSPGPDPGPSPLETDALAWAAMDERAQRRHRPGARALAALLDGRLRPFRTEKQDERTNVIDQGERATYALPPAELADLLDLLEKCRLEGSITHFSERQGTAAAPKSGLMLDFDLVVPTRTPELVDRHYFRLANALVQALQRDIDFAGAPSHPTHTLSPFGVARSASHPAEMKFHVFFIVKPAAVAVTPAAAAAAARNEATEAATGPPPSRAEPSQKYKYGFHILVPGVRLTRSYKKWLLRQFRADPAVLATLQEIGAAPPAPAAPGDLQACLDQNSASVPVLFFGSCKRGGTPYVLGAALEVVADIAYAGGAPMTRKLDAAALAPYNLAAELGLAAGAAVYPDGRPGLVARAEFECRPEVAAAARDWGERGQGGAGAAREEELLLAEHSLSTLTLHNAEARQLHALLDLLGPEYSADRNKWRDVVYALANTSDQYKPLAVWFSQRCPQKWAEGGAEALDQLWDEAAGGCGGRAAAKPLTLRSLAYWARAADPARYAEVMERSYFTMLTEFVYTFGGKLQHYMIAKVLHVMLGAKFCVDVDPRSERGRGPQTYQWFEFVVPGQPMRPGEVWKWRREKEPDDMHVYISEKLTRVMAQIAEHLEQRRQAADAESQGKYYAQLCRNFEASRGRLYEDGFKNHVINQATYLFRRRGFFEQLDQTPFLFGTLNGVLRLGPRLQLIDYFHEYPVSLFTPVAWKPFDPADPWTRLALDAIADIIPEPDARDFILFHAAQGLSAAEKDGIFLMWEGGGQNGKTSFLRWVAKALGPRAAKFNIQLMCCEREDADRPNSAMMRFKYLNYAYSEETNQSQVLNAARMKEMVNAGEVSGRELRGTQEEFTMHCNIVAASQYSFVVTTTDHGTWRRMKHYRSKTRFRQNPDPADPFEKKDDQRFVRQYPNDPQFQSSILSILGHYYGRLEREHGGELKNVATPTIERETETFRRSQDVLHRWICEAVVVSPGGNSEYTMGLLSGHFTDWYNLNVGRQGRAAAATIQDIENSALSKFLARGANHALVLRGCRVLLPGDMQVQAHERYLVAVTGGDPQLGDAPAPEQVPTAVAVAPSRADWWDAGPEAPGPPLAPLRDGAAAAATPLRSAIAAGGEEPPDDLFDMLEDDAVMLRTEATENAAARAAATALRGGDRGGPRADAAGDADRVLALLLGEGENEYTLDDVYG